jgi:hypothetical protein
VIRDHLIPALQSEFVGWDMVFDVPPSPIVTFPAVQPEIGRVFVYDEKHEALVVIEHVTHTHFNAYPPASEAERAAIIAEDVVEFLKALFSDRVLLFVSSSGRGNGWTRLDVGSESQDFLSAVRSVVPLPSMRYFLWSRPYEAP